MKMYEGEVFKVVTSKEYPQLKTVQVSNYGRVKRGYYILNKKKRYNANGYEVVYINEVHKELLVHRLIADTFHHEGHTDERPFVDHIDGNKTNNRADNLEWVTNQENVQRFYNSIDAYEKRLRGSICNILVTDMETKMSVIYPTITAAAEALGIQTIYISECIASQRKYYKKYMFFKLADIKGKITNEEEGMHSGINREVGYWAQVNFDGYSIRVTDNNLGRSTQKEMEADAKILKEIIEKRLTEGD